MKGFVFLYSTRSFNKYHRWNLCFHGFIVTLFILKRSIIQVTERKIDDFHGSDGNCNFSTYASLVYEISFSDTLYGRFYQDDESNRLNSSYGWSCGYRNEAVMVMVSKG